MESVQKILMSILVAIILVSFFLPWITVESAAVGEITEILTGKRQVSSGSISGFKLPILANSPESRLAISILKDLSPGIKDADKKSYLVWIAPALAALMLIAKYLLNKNRWANLILGLLGCLIFIVAVHKLGAVNLDTLLLKIDIAYGLRLILISYLGMGLLCLTNLVYLIRQKGNQAG